MAENLKVNARTDILEFKRKHNLLVENGTIKTTVSNIKQLTNADIENLSCGDIVLKEDASGKHAYLVSFKSDTGLCLTYCDASCVETQSYDKVGNNWQYNSQDLTFINRMEQVDDKDGHKRFIEGDISTVEITGVEYVFAKWSLSGTHLLIVLAGNITGGTILSSSLVMGRLQIPEFIYNKIYPMKEPFVAFKNGDLLDGYVIKYNSLRLDKINDSSLQILNRDSIQLTNDTAFRFEFDLLIDNE